MSAWRRVCELSALTPDRGAAVLMDEQQIALFRIEADEALFAVSHHDPFSGANVLARGLVGSRAGAHTVASPMHKQVFDLRTGQCLDDPDVRIDVWDTRIVDGWIELSERPVRPQT
ncbi:nitrite reductase small subunit NirD [soil metagenome]